MSARATLLPLVLISLSLFSVPAYSGWLDDLAKGIEKEAEKILKGTEKTPEQSPQPEPEQSPSAASAPLPESATETEPEQARTGASDTSGSRGTTTTASTSSRKTGLCLSGACLDGTPRDLLQSTWDYLELSQWPLRNPREPSILILGLTEDELKELEYWKIMSKGVGRALTLLGKVQTVCAPVVVTLSRGIVPSGSVRVTLTAFPSMNGSQQRPVVVTVDRSYTFPSYQAEEWENKVKAKYPSAINQSRGGQSAGLSYRVAGTSGTISIRSTRLGPGSWGAIRKTDLEKYPECTQKTRVKISID